MDRIPADLESAVRNAARTNRGYAGEVGHVYRRARRRRARRAVVAGAAAFFVLVGVGVALRRPARGQEVHPAASATVAAPQRLLLRGASGEYRSVGAAVTRLGGARLGELLPDGRIVVVPAIDGDDAGLADGRMVGLDGGELVVTEADGAVRLRRDVRRAGEQVGLLTASATTAYLWRPRGLVAHDLATGAERTAITARYLEVGTPFDGTVVVADLAGDRFVIVRAKELCGAYVLNARSGGPMVRMDLPGFACNAVINVRVSPGATRVAVAYRTAEGLRVMTGSADSGAMLTDEAVPGRWTDSAHVDLAWRDEHRVCGVVVPSGPGVHVLTQFEVVTG